MRRNTFIIGLLAIAVCAGIAMSQGTRNAKIPKEVPPVDSIPENDGPRVTFSIDSLADIEHTVSRRSLAVQTAIEKLEAASKGAKLDDLTIARSADLLARLHADDRRSVKALIANLEFRPTVSDAGEPQPLQTLDAARALRRIGGRAVAEELIRCLRVQRTKKEHLIIANILTVCDDPDVTNFRLRRAIEAEETDKNPDQGYIGQIKAVRYWLDNPALLDKPENWPSTM
jgi:hypothetical protein